MFISFQISEDESFFKYTEWASKCNPGGVDNVNKKPKEVKVYATTNKNRCPIILLKKYLNMT